MKILIVFTFLLSLVFVETSQAQNNPYPNELKGYEFARNGKLKGLTPGVSTKADVKKIFGKNCENQCDYDTDWTVNFSYYENNWIKDNTNEKGEKSVYYLDFKYLGNLRKIEIRPKRQVSFGKVSFPKTFQKLSRSLITDDTRTGKNRMITYELFQDSLGLTYELFGTTDYDNIKAKSEKLYKKGDLFSIQYSISKEQEKVMFILQKNK
jgi:hypothetical protein